MTVVGRVRRGYAILAILILLTAGLYVARYLAVDRPNNADRVTEQSLTAVGQTVPTAVAMYSAWIDKGLLYGGMSLAAPTVLIDDSHAATTALSQMNGHVGGGVQTRLATLQTTLPSFSPSPRRPSRWSRPTRWTRPASWRRVESTHSRSRC